MMEILPSVVISPHPHFPNSPNIPSINAPQFPNREEDGQIIEREEDDLVANPTSPFIPLDSSAEERKSARNRDQSPILALLLTVLRKSVVMTCSVEKVDSWEIEISRPTDVRHVAHVTFDRFNGFLGLPDEFEPEVPRRAPSASASVFGVSAESMQCSYDARGNSVPTILLMIQRRLYSDGGLQSEGIFRINAENGQEEYVRDQLNRGVVPFGVDLHCLAGLIKAWFRELPRGILDSLSPDQVMQCNSEEDCTQLVELLPPTEAALLDWAINLMADVVQCEHLNKMNAHNIAMVFAPNMTQMADPLTALIHAVQVMNFLKTLIIKRLRERDDSIVKAREQTSCSGSPSDKDNPSSLNSTQIVRQESQAATPNNFYHDASMFFRSRDCMSASDIEDSFRSFGEECIADNDDDKFVGSVGSPGSCRVADADENGCRRKYANGDVEGFLDRLRLRRGVRKMCLHPIFKLSRPGKKNNNGLGIVSSSVGSEEAWA